MLAIRYIRDNEWATPVRVRMVWNRFGLGASHQAGIGGTTHADHPRRGKVGWGGHGRAKTAVDGRHLWHTVEYHMEPSTQFSHHMSNETNRSHRALRCTEGSGSLSEGIDG